MCLKSEVAVLKNTKYYEVGSLPSDVLQNNCFELMKCFSKLLSVAFKICNKSESLIWKWKLKKWFYPPIKTPSVWCCQASIRQSASSSNCLLLHLSSTIWDSVWVWTGKIDERSYQIQWTYVQLCQIRLRFWLRSFPIDGMNEDTPERECWCT